MLCISQFQEKHRIGYYNSVSSHLQKSFQRNRLLSNLNLLLASYSQEFTVEIYQVSGPGEPSLLVNSCDLHLLTGSAEHPPVMFWLMYYHWLVLASLGATHLSAPPGSWLWSRYPRTTSHLSNEDVTVVPGPCQLSPQCKDPGSLCWKTCLRAQKEVGFLVLLVSTGLSTLTGGVCRADANPCTQPALSTGSLGFTELHLPCTCYRWNGDNQEAPPPRNSGLCPCPRYAAGHWRERGWE